MTEHSPGLHGALGYLGLHGRLQCGFVVRGVECIEVPLPQVPLSPQVEIVAHEASTAAVAESGDGCGEADKWIVSLYGGALLL